MRRNLLTVHVSLHNSVIGVFTTAIIPVIPCVRPTVNAYDIVAGHRLHTMGFPATQTAGQERTRMSDELRDQPLWIALPGLVRGLRLLLSAARLIVGPEELDPDQLTVHLMHHPPIQLQFG